MKEDIARSRSTAGKDRLSLALEATKLHELYRTVIETSIRLLEQTIHGSVARGVKAKADYLALVAEGMSKKLSLQHGQLMSQLYSPDLQEALVRRLGELQAEHGATKRRVWEAEGKMEEYRRAGGMESVAREYAEILKETDKVKADIARLGEDGRQ